MRLLRSGAANDGEQCVRVIVLFDAIAAAKTACGAAVDYRITGRRTFECDRLHHAAACRGAVAGVDVNMLAPETLRTMIRIARPLYLGTAMVTNEILYRALELFTRHICTVAERKARANTN